MNLILKDIKNGNPEGDGYTVKEILTAHIHDTNDFQNRLLDDLNKVKETYSTKKMVFGISTLIVGWLSWLTLEFWKYLTR